MKAKRKVKKEEKNGEMLCGDHWGWDNRKSNAPSSTRGSSNYNRWSNQRVNSGKEIVIILI